MAINDIRQAVLSQTFEDAIGKRVLVMTPFFPFLIIGEIKNVKSDFIIISIETTHIQEIEGQRIRIHIDDIDVFHIEEDGSPIPRFNEAEDHHKKGG
ncbi:hypothetical protein ELQ35_10530 [Peribacillus cavernae]|uniref:DUF2642 domain-containing protein n=2 Tax=Peribacillus cavernae TaxID=1674310 RepID=A0A433HM02_9BACI|nr:hypothetical protein ELQ35_10530 [Peribacillus cavernae]